MTQHKINFTAEQITALFIEAARSSDIDLLSQFLEAGMPVDCTDSRGYTPLIVATYNDHLETARFLLEKGANPDAVDLKVQPPFQALRSRVMRRLPIS